MFVSSNYKKYKADMADILQNFIYKMCFILFPTFALFIILDISVMHPVLQPLVAMLLQNCV